VFLQGYQVHSSNYPYAFSQPCYTRPPVPAGEIRTISDVTPYLHACEYFIAEQLWLAKYLQISLFILLRLNVHDCHFSHNIRIDLTSGYPAGPARGLGVAKCGRRGFANQSEGMIFTLSSVSANSLKFRLATFLFKFISLVQPYNCCTYCFWKACHSQTWSPTLPSVMLVLMMVAHKYLTPDLTDPTRPLDHIQAPQQQVSASLARFLASYILDTVTP
jgi:hypothetical protein